MNERFIVSVVHRTMLGRVHKITRIPTEPGCNHLFDLDNIGVAFLHHLLTSAEHTRWSDGARAEPGVEVYTSDGTIQLTRYTLHDLCAAKK